MSTDKNNVEVVGTVKGEPRMFTGKHTVRKLNVVTQVTYQKADGTEGSRKSTIPVTAFNFAAKDLAGAKEGTRVRIVGYITNNSYVSSKTGQTVWETVVIANSAKVLGSAQTDENQEEFNFGPPPMGRDEIPF